jgi:hypothetical protein
MSLAEALSFYDTPPVNRVPEWLASSRADDVQEVVVDRSRLLAEILERLPPPGGTTYLERRGNDDAWRCVDIGAPLPTPGEADVAPEAWMLYSGSWPLEDPQQLASHLDDMLAQMESMCGGTDRGRWPVDQPYPHQH